MGTVGPAIEGFFTDLKALLQIIAPIFAFLGNLTQANGLSAVEWAIDRKKILQQGTFQTEQDIDVQATSLSPKPNFAEIDL